MYNEHFSTIATAIIFSRIVGDRVFTRKDFENCQAEIKSFMSAGLFPCNFETIRGYLNIQRVEDFEVITVSDTRYGGEKVELTREEYEAIPPKVRNLLDISVQSRKRYYYQFSQRRIAHTKEELRKFVD